MGNLNINIINNTWWVKEEGGVWSSFANVCGEHILWCDWYLIDYPLEDFLWMFSPEACGHKELRDEGENVLFEGFLGGLAQCVRLFLETPMWYLLVQFISEIWFVAYAICIHIQIPPDWLCRSNIMQYHCGYCKSDYLLGYCEVTARTVAPVTVCQSTLIVSTMVLQLAIATAVLCNVRPT